MNEAAREMTPRRRTVILVSCCLSLLIVTMDATIVNVALPSIRDDLAATPAQLQWVVDIYTLVLASLLMLAGGAADRLGRRRVFQTGLVIFAAGSLACSLAPTIEALIASRFLQGIGGSMLNPVALSIISQIFTGPVERAKALGIWGAVVGISMSLGPIVGGLLIESIGWRSVFWINLPICVAAIVLTAIFVPESKSATMRSIDPVGQVLAVLFLFGTVYTLIEGPVLGWSSPQVLVSATVSAVAFLAFLRYESRRDDPFVDLRFFRSIPFSAAVVNAMSAFAAWAAFLFMMSLYLQGERGFSPMETGLIYLPIAVGAVLFSPLSGRLVGRYGARPSLVAAGTLIATASAMLSFLTATTPVWSLLIVFAVFGIGFSMVNAPVSNSAVSGMPLDRAGAASAVASTSRQVGVSVGVALCGSVAGAAMADGGAGFAAAAHPMWFVCIALGLVILANGLFATSQRAARSAERLAVLVEGAPVSVEGAHGR